MRAAKILLELLTLSHPPPQGAKHALVVHEDKLMVVLAWADPTANAAAFQHFTLEDEDLDRPAHDIHADIESLIAQYLSTPVLRSLDDRTNPVLEEPPLVYMAPPGVYPTSRPPAMPRCPSSRPG